MDFMNMLFMNNWLMYLMNDRLVMLMYNGLVLLFDDVLVVFVDNILMLFFNDWGLDVLLNNGSFEVLNNFCLESFLLYNCWFNVLDNYFLLSELLNDWFLHFSSAEADLNVFRASKTFVSSKELLISQTSQLCCSNKIGTGQGADVCVFKLTI